MRCAECRDLLSAQLDLEVSPEQSRDVRAHLAQCVECTRAYADLESTSDLLQRDLVHYTAPDVLKARIHSALVDSDRQGTSATILSRRWLRLAAAGLVIAVTSSVVTYATTREGAASKTVRDEVLGSHVRSLMPGHLTDVASNNQHNVKPWFNGRVNLSPAVPSLDSSGYNLAGGRVDYVAGHSVAALVYLRRLHVVNVFTWPEEGRDMESPSTTAQGYHLFSWRANNMAFWVASDLNTSELSEFVTLFKRASGAR